METPFAIMRRMYDDGDEIVSQYEVKAPSGATLSVLTEQEVLYVEERVERYLKDNHFVNISDLQDVDRMLMMELMTWRWATWLAQNQDYWGNDIVEEDLRRNIREYSTELRQVKKLLGIDKAARDKERGESVSDYLDKLRQRAREFGVMREKQLDKALILFNELKALVTLHENCTEEERRENNVEMHDVWEWIRDIAIPEFDEIDTYFRENQQRYWVRDQ